MKKSTGSVAFFEDLKLAAVVPRFGPSDVPVPNVARWPQMEARDSGRGKW